MSGISSGDGESIGSGGSGYEGIHQIDAPTFTLSNYSKTSCPLGAGTIKGQDPVLKLGKECFIAYVEVVSAPAARHVLDSVAQFMDYQRGQPEVGILSNEPQDSGVFLRADQLRDDVSIDKECSHSSSNCSPASVA